MTPGLLTKAVSIALRIQLIGRFSLTDGAGEALTLKSRRARALLAYLALEPRQSEERGRLAGLLWSDRPEAQARASLRQCLADLRAALPADGLEIGRESVSLVPGAVASDVAELERDFDERRVGDAVARLRTMHGAVLLRDLELPGLFADWLDQARGQFERRLTQNVHAALAAMAPLQAWRDVRALAQAHLNRDPVDEVVAAALMRADFALGDASAARRRFQNLTQALDRAFGVEPGEDARAALAFAAPPSDPAPPAPEPTPEPARLGAGAAASHLPLVVVAAIESARLQDDDRYLGAVMRDEVIAGLSAFRDFRVTTASVGLADLDKEVWAQRGAAYILGGGVRRTDKGFRLTAQLLRAGDQQVIWSERIDAAAVGVSETVEHIIAQVVGAVSPSIDADLERRGAPRPDSLYARYVGARAASLAPRTWDEAREAAAAIEALIAEDPSFTLPYLPLARLYNTDFGFTRAGSSGPAERARAFALAKIALAQDRGHIHAYTVVGWCYMRRREWTAARAHFDQAMRLNPFHSDRVMECAFGYLGLGDVDEAEALLKRCLLLSPTPKDNYYTDLALLEILRGDYDRAARYLDLVARPTIWDTLYQAISAALGAGRDSALSDAAWTRIAAIWPDRAPMTVEAVAQWVLEHHPLAVEAASRRLLEGVRQALG